MQTEFSTRPKTKKNETDYIAELHKDLTDYGEKQYTNFYDFVNGDRVKITVEIVEDGGRKNASKRTIRLHTGKSE